jgi:hypothetical protein
MKPPWTKYDLIYRRGICSLLKEAFVVDVVAWHALISSVNGLFSGYCNVVAVIDEKFI